MRRVTKENLSVQIDRLRKIKDEQGQLSMSSEYTLQAYEMLLATMDSEPVEMPLDYLQGHKDGLEWVSQLAEANHPETGDWIYDDPIELAKAIHKGPDMPPAPPAPVEAKESDELYDVIDGDDNVVLSAVSYNEAQTESDGYNGEDLYIVRHEVQPALVVPEEMTPEMMRSVQLNSELGAYAASNLPGAYDLFAEFWKVACRAAMLAATRHDTPALNSLQSVDSVADRWIPVSEQMPENKPGSYEYIVFETLNNRVNHDYWNVPDKGDDAFTPFWNYYGDYVTHWMPFPTFNRK